VVGVRCINTHFSRREVCRKLSVLVGSEVVQKDIDDIKRESTRVYIQWLHSKRYSRVACILGTLLNQQNI